MPSRIRLPGATCASCRRSAVGPADVREQRRAGSAPPEAGTAAGASGTPSARAVLIAKQKAPRSAEHERMRGRCVPPLQSLHKFTHVLQHSATYAPQSMKACRKCDDHAGWVSPAMAVMLWRQGLERAASAGKDAEVRHQASPRQPAAPVVGRCAPEARRRTSVLPSGRCAAGLLGGDHGTWQPGRSFLRL